MHVIVLLAGVAFLASAIWAGIQRAWPVALIGLGLFLIVLDASSLVTS